MESSPDRSRLVETLRRRLAASPEVRLAAENRLVDLEAFVAAIRPRL